MSVPINRYRPDEYDRESSSPSMELHQQEREPMPVTRLRVKSLITAAKRRFQSRELIIQYIQSRINEATDESSLIHRMLSENHLRYLPSYGVTCSELDVAITLAFQYKKQIDSEYQANNNHNHAILLCKDAYAQTETDETLIHHQLSECKRELLDVWKQNQLLQRTVKRLKQEIESYEFNEHAFNCAIQQEGNQTSTCDGKIDMCDESSLLMNSIPFQSSEDNIDSTGESEQGDPMYVFVLSPDDNEDVDEEEKEEEEEEEEEERESLNNKDPMEAPDLSACYLKPISPLQSDVDLIVRRAELPSALTTEMCDANTSSNEHFIPMNEDVIEEKSERIAPDVVISPPSVNESASMCHNQATVPGSRSSPFIIAVQPTVALATIASNNTDVKVDSHINSQGVAAASTFVEYLHQRGMSINDAWKTRSAAQLYLEWDSLRKRC